MNRLHTINTLPETFLDLSYRDIKKVFPRPTLIYLKGKKKSALFVSILLHGNEFSGLEIMQDIFKKYRTNNGYDLPRDLWLFIGNVDAAEAGLRAIEGQTDFNRAWPGTPDPETDTAKLIKKVFETINKDPLFAAIDLHNNTGQNPPYGCITDVNEENKYLCAFFNHIAMVFKSPKGVSTMAFDGICPAITLECSIPGNKLAKEKAFALVDDLMHMDHFPIKSLARHDLQLVKNSATVKIGQNVSFCFEDDAGSTSDTDLTIVKNFDHHNFTMLEKEEVFAYTKVDKPILVISPEGEDITHKIIQNKNGGLSLRKAMMPAMITLDKSIVLQDCLCYLLEDY